MSSETVTRVLVGKLEKMRPVGNNFAQVEEK
jgi:hypothetical protein